MDLSKIPEPTRHENKPVCPWCGHVMKDAWELRDEQETDCGECLKPIFVSRYTTCTYSTFPVTPSGVHDPE